ncbi:tetratricopeptide repeat protein [Telluria aromaticivorans]|uniref:Tetratricopeptide repeat protein n=1 Tax=Telluria aromaticivorans TaxID=2725995 RepID=A0A7Y2JZL4_9BURK|nr:tetratricopeptide repeat protein [Telluria aromaticivorans]NNG23942.1 tetratricopeptide repeat protein [Telluria aromaticivorans]
MKNAFVIVTLSSILAACAVAPTQQPAVASSAALAAGADIPLGQEQDDTAAATESAEELEAKLRAEVEARLPKVELTSSMLNQLLKAEFAFRKGDWQGPYLTMLSLAQQTRDPRLARRAAEMAVTARQPDDTLAAVRLWRELDPASDEATQYFVGMVVTSDAIAEVEPIFAERLKAAPEKNRGVLMFQIQQLLGRAKDKDAAAAMLERIVTPYNGTLEAHIVRAQAALARADKGAAVREAQAALAAKPDSEIAMLMMAQVLEDDAKVAPMLEAFLKQHPEAREVRAAHARVLVNQKQFPQARAQFEALLKARPDDAGNLYALGVLASQMNDAKAAETYFTRFVEILGRNPEDDRDPTRALLILAQLAEDRGDYPGALKWLEKVPAGTEPQLLFSAQLRRAGLLAKGGDLAGGRQLLASLKPAEPVQQAQVAVAESQLLRDAGQVLEAYTLMEAAAQRFPKNPDLLYDFALLAEKIGRVEVMEKVLREVMALAPDNHHAYNALGYSLAERNIRLQEAHELIGKALAMAPGDPFIMDSMGWVQYRLGKLDEAEKYLRQAYALRRDPEIAVHLGEVLFQKGRQADAQQLWREARAKDPQNDTLRSTLARLRQTL